MNVVAHPGDDVAFFGAAEIEDIAAGACVRTVYLTAGDAATDPTERQNREIGAVFAHETMAGERHKPSRDEPLKITGRRLAMRTLARNEKISLVFLRLPGGSEARSAPNAPDLAALWTGAVPSLATVDGAEDDGLGTRQSYSKPALVTTLYKLMTEFGPDRIRTQNFRDATLDGARGAIDHPDHAAAAFFAYEAAKAYAPRLGAPIAEVVAGYRGHDTADYVQNLAGPALDAKRAAFADYARFDRSVCADPLDCSAYRRGGAEGGGYARWLRREYTLDAELPAFVSAQFRMANGQCMAARGSVAVGEPCAAADDFGQQWVRDEQHGLISTPGSSRCLATDGAGAVLRTCDPRDGAQRWALTQDGEAWNAGSRKCLTAPANGGPMALSACAYSARQLFGYEQDQIKPVAHALIGASDKCLTLDAGVGGRASMRACAGAATSRWFFTPGGALRNGDGGLCLGPERGGPTGGPAVSGQACERPTSTLRWRYDPASGEVALLAPGRPRQCLETSDGRPAEGAGVRIAECDGSEAQKWAVDSD